MYRAARPMFWPSYSWPVLARAADHLLYFEAQGIAGYSTEQKKTIYYSQNPNAEMQKPSVGFDYLQRFSGESGDWAHLCAPGPSGPDRRWNTRGE